MITEIERKFLVGEVPEGVKRRRTVVVHQGYLAREGDREVRIRRAGSRHMITVKTGSGLERTEYETAIRPRQFLELWQATEGRRVEKERMYIPHGRYTLEVDRYHGALEGLMTGEVEFPDVQTAEAFIPPPWFGPELTDDLRFGNRELALLDRSAARETLGSLLDGVQLAYGTVPLVRHPDGSLETVVITTSRRNRWIFPKGRPEPAMDPREVAAMEAREEAGLEGTVLHTPHVLHYWNGWQCFRISYYVMEVATVHPHWDEEHRRERRVCSIDEAVTLLADGGFPELLRSAAADFSSGKGRG